MKFNFKWAFFVQLFVSIGLYLFSKDLEMQTYNYFVTIVFLIFWRTKKEEN